MMFEKLYALIRLFEGFRSKPYICPAGVPTIGYGSTTYDGNRKVTMQDKPISEPAADAMMMRDADGFARAAATISPILWLEHDKHQAIADFCYNLGTTRYKSSTLRRKVDSKDWDGAKRELMKWVYGGGKKLPGLVKRRQAECALMV